MTKDMTISFVADELDVRVGSLSAWDAACVEELAQMAWESHGFTLREAELLACGLRWRTLGKDLRCTTSSMLHDVAITPLSDAFVQQLAAEIDSSVLRCYALLAPSRLDAAHTGHKLVMAGTRLYLALQALRDIETTDVTAA